MLFRSTAGGSGGDRGLNEKSVGPPKGKWLLLPLGLVLVDIVVVSSLFFPLCSSSSSCYFCFCRIVVLNCYFCCYGAFLLLWLFGCRFFLALLLSVVLVILVLFVPAILICMVCLPFSLSFLIGQWGWAQHHMATLRPSVTLRCKAQCSTGTEAHIDYIDCYEIKQSVALLHLLAAVRFSRVSSCYSFWLRSLRTAWHGIQSATPDNCAQCYESRTHLQRYFSIEYPSAQCPTPQPWTLQPQIKLSPFQSSKNDKKTKTCHRYRATESGFCTRCVLQVFFAFRRIYNGSWPQTSPRTRRFPIAESWW